MKITELTTQQKNKDRLNVFIDGKFAFGLHIEVVIKYHIKKNQELSDDLLEEIKSADAFQQAYDKSLNFLSARPRSSREITQYLRQRLIYKHPDYMQLTQTDEKQQFMAGKVEYIEQILNKLSLSGYVDDVEFARWWISNRQQFKPRGKRLLLLELKAKGVSNADIETALMTPREEGHFSSEREEYSEAEAAKQLAGKYLRKYSTLPAREQKQRLSRYLAGKGFDWDTINQVAQEIIDDQE